MAEIRVGTSAFMAAGWESAFYPAGMKPADYLFYYPTRFDTVEVDSTFYATPSAATVMGWTRKTPDNFVFALKVPQNIFRILHLEKCLQEHNLTPQELTEEHARAALDSWGKGRTIP